jgi:hypothetical protein
MKPLTKPKSRFEYLKQRRQEIKSGVRVVLCDCGQTAIKLVAGGDGVCARCVAIEGMCYSTEIMRGVVGYSRRGKLARQDYFHS